MPSFTTRLGLRRPLAAENPDIPSDIVALTNQLDVAAIDGQGLLSARPVSTPGSPGVVGRYFYATDTGILYRDFGTGWVDVSEAPGDLKPTLRSAADPGWVMAFGQVVSRTTYSLLFAVIGVTYGVGDGSTTFGLPDLRGRVPVGLDNMGGTDAGRLAAANTLGGTGGAETHTLTTAQMPSHSHGGITGNDSPDHTHLVGNHSAAGTVAGTAAAFYDPNISGVNVNVTSGGRSVVHQHPITAEGGGTAHNNMQPFMLCNWMIRTCV